MLISHTYIFRPASQVYRPAWFFYLCARNCRRWWSQLIITHAMDFIRLVWVWLLISQYNLAPWQTLFVLSSIYIMHPSYISHTSTSTMTARANPQLTPCPATSDQLWRQLDVAKKQGVRIHWSALVMGQRQDHIVLQRKISEVCEISLSSAVTRPRTKIFAIRTQDWRLNFKILTIG
jgi:hypothetical protein